MAAAALLELVFPDKRRQVCSFLLLEQADPRWHR